MLRTPLSTSPLNSELVEVGVLGEWATDTPRDDQHMHTVLQ